MVQVFRFKIVANKCKKTSYNCLFLLFQGHTVKYPDSLVLDLICWLQPAMVYVALSRVQCLEQLFILENLPVEKIKPWPDAIIEKRRLDDLDRNRQFGSSFSVCTLNVNSLGAHFEDLKMDRIITANTIICCQETWLSPHSLGSDFQLEGKICHLNSVRRGAGIATYFSREFQHIKDYTATSYQISVFKSDLQMVMNIYRSNDANSEVIQHNLANMMKEWSGDIFLCGDWNLCLREDRNHRIMKFLMQEGFSPVIQPPKGTHKDGRCIDMIWSRNVNLDSCASKIDFKYYTDHGQVSLLKLS